LLPHSEIVISAAMKITVEGYACDAVEHEIGELEG
jgi:hypothetical protein